MDAEVKEAKKSLRAVLVEQRGGPLPNTRNLFIESLNFVGAIITVVGMTGMGVAIPSALAMAGGDWQEPLGGKISGLVVLGVWFTLIAWFWLWMLLHESFGSPRARMFSTLPLSPVEILKHSRWVWLRSIIYLWIYACLVTSWLGFRAWVESKGTTSWLGNSPWVWIGWGTMFALHASALALLQAALHMLLFKWRIPSAPVRIVLMLLLALMMLAALLREHLMSAAELAAWSGVIAKWLPTLWGMWALTTVAGGSLLPVMSVSLILGAVWVWCLWPQSMLWKVLEYPKASLRILGMRPDNKISAPSIPKGSTSTEVPLAERIRAVYNSDELKVGWQERLLTRGWGEAERTIYRCRFHGAPAWSSSWYWSLVSLIIWLGIWIVVRSEAPEWVEKRGEDQRAFQLTMIAIVVVAFISFVSKESRKPLKPDTIRKWLAWRLLPLSGRKILIQEWKIMIGRVALMFPLWLAAAAWIAWMRAFKSFGLEEAIVLVVKLTVILLASKPMFIFSNDSNESSQMNLSHGVCWKGVLRVSVTTVLFLSSLLVAGFMVWCGGNYWWQLLITLVGTLLLLVSSLMCYSLTLSGLNRRPINFPQGKYS